MAALDKRIICQFEYKSWLPRKWSLSMIDDYIIINVFTGLTVT